MTIADISSSIHALAGRWAALDEGMKLAAEYLFVASVLVLLVAWFRRDGLRTVVAAAIGAVLAVAAGALIGMLWSEPRPFVADHFAPLIAHSVDASFPSDHLLAIGGIAGGTWTDARPLSWIVAVLALVVAFARVFVGVHYVGDVVAGFAIGWVCGLAAWHALAPVTPVLTRISTVLARLGLRRGNDGPPARMADR